jgi:hypothetical protein
MISLINYYRQCWSNIKSNYPILYQILSDNYKLILVCILGILGILILGLIGWLGAVGQVLAGIGLFWAADIAYKRWIVDARRTALLLNINSKVINNLDRLVLLAINIKLENKGVKRITARQYKDKSADKNSNYLYVSEQGVDYCVYAGTLKIRRVPIHLNDVKFFDWYSLEPITDQLIVKDMRASLGNFEQINYLDEFGITSLEGDGRDVNCFIEANEPYNQQVIVLLPPGLYAIKAYFLGKYSEEYWSCTKIINI